METLALPHLPDIPIVLGLFMNVKNAAFLRQQLLAGNTAFEYVFLDASILVSRSQVLAACFRAINDWTNNRLKSRNVHSEVVFSLSPNNNIAESFRRFGISDATTDLVAIKIGAEPADVEKHLSESIEGSVTALSDEALKAIHNVARIRKIYRCEAVKNDQDKALKPSEEAYILGSMALRGS